MSDLFDLPEDERPEKIRAARVMIAEDDPAAALIVVGPALETLVAAALLYAGAFSATAACGIVVAFTCLALLGAAWRRSGAAT